MRPVKPDAEFKRFVALGMKIARRLRKSGVEMKFVINFGPLPPTQGKEVGKDD